MKTKTETKRTHNPATHFICKDGYVRKRKVPTFKRLKLKESRRRAKVTLQVCENCGKREENKGRTWCNCNPTAPFQMIPCNIAVLVDNQLAQLKPTHFGA
tara:strand:+ start:422 stop:721 length:300 start_codon:yes stop_codon:yes gene_type:complete